MAGNFDSDEQTELALIFQGDFPASERDGNGDDSFGFFGGTVKTLHTKVFKWDNEHGRFNSKDSVRQDYSFSKQEFWAEGYSKTYQQGVMVPVPA